MYPPQNMSPPKAAGPDEIALRRGAHELGERVKELNCLYAISRLTLEPGASLSDIFRGTLAVIPPAWQYPEVTGARILFADQVWATGNFHETPWMLGSEVFIGEAAAGGVEVVYLEERPPSDEGPFLREERSLLNAIAERLTQAIQHKQTEDALHHSREQARLLADNVTDLAVYRYSLRPEMGFEYVSPSVAAVTGFTSEEFYSDPDLFLKNTHQEDRLLVEKALLAPESSREASNLRWVRKDGRIIWLQQRQMPIFDSRGEITAIEGVISDITDRRRVEDALRDSEKRQEVLLQAAPAVLFRKQAAKDFATTWASEKARPILGFPAARFGEDGQFWLSRVHPEDREGALAHYRLALRLGSAAFEYRWRCADDAHHWFVDRALFVRGQSQAPGELLVTTMDISDRKRRARSGEDLGSPRASSHLVSPASNWRRAVVALPVAEAATRQRPANCPRCGSAILQRHQTHLRLLKGREAPVEVVRYLCTACGRTFCHYPQGVDRRQQSPAVRCSIAILYGLGLSLSQVRTILQRAGVEVARGSIWRLAKGEGETMRCSRPPGVVCLLSDESTPTTGQFVVVEDARLQEGAEPAKLELLIWERQGLVYAWLKEQLDRLGLPAQRERQR